MKTRVFCPSNGEFCEITLLTSLPVDTGRNLFITYNVCMFMFNGCLSIQHLREMFVIPSGKLGWESLCANDTVYFSYFCQALPFEQSNKIITFVARDYNVENGRAG